MNARSQFTANTLARSGKTWREAQRRRLLGEQARLRNRWDWWAVNVRDYALLNLDAIGKELTAVRQDLDELDRRDAADAAEGRP